MGNNRSAIPSALRGKGLPAWLLLFAWLLLSLPAADRLLAQGAPQGLQINYRDQLLSISARNVDIKDFLTGLSEKAHITIEFPASLKKNITLNRENISLRGFLSNFLRNMNHVIIYSGSDPENSRISEVHIYPGSTTSRSSISSSSYPYTGPKGEIRRRIDTYKKIVERLRSRLSGEGENGSHSAVYLNRIHRYEERIKKLESQLY